MLKLALMFFLISLVAGFFGFSGVATATAGIAKVLFVGFILVALALTVAGVMLGKKLVKGS